MAEQFSTDGITTTDFAELASVSQQILKEYLSALQAIRATGRRCCPETSYYPALSNLFNEIGKTLKPKVRCIINIANRGAGIPDGGLFTIDQFQAATLTAQRWRKQVNYRRVERLRSRERSPR